MISLRSKLRSRLLSHFYVNRKSRVYVRHLATLLQVDSTNLSRELARLESEGFLRFEVEGRQKYYSINTNYPHLKSVFNLLRGSVGIIPTLTSALAGVDRIESAYLFGSFARNEQDEASDIDLLLMGEPDVAELAIEVAKAERILRREVNYSIFKPDEFDQKLANKDPFLTDVWQGKRIELIKGVGSGSYAQNQAATG
jgi:predicted nucleotidyltransferase